MRGSRAFLTALLGGMGVLHVVAPKPFEAQVPSWVPGSPKAWNLVAAAGELTSSFLLARNRTVRAGGALAFATLATVYPANIQHVFDGGISGAPGWFSTRSFAVLRLPLQLPMLLWAYRLWRRGAP